MKIEFVTVDPIRINDVCSFVNEWNSDLDFIESKTSGSTGRPKTIRLLKKHMIASAKMTGEFLGLKANDSALLCMTTEAISGKMMIVRALFIGLELDYIIPSSNLDDLQKDKIYDFIAIVPLQAENSLNKLDQFKKIIIAKNNQEIADNCNWGFLSITPLVGEKIIKNLKFKSNQIIISFISTITLSELKKAIKVKAKIVRAIPLPPI